MNDLISRQTAIDATWFEPSYTDPLNVLTEVRDRLKVLPSAQPTQTNCEYCHTDNDGYVLPLEKNSHAFIDRNKIVLKANGWRGEAKIKYCPMCGRRLIDG